MSAVYLFAFASTLDGQVDGGRLHTAIDAVLDDLEKVETGDMLIRIYFSDPLDSGEETILEGVIAAHSGATSPSTPPGGGSVSVPLLIPDGGMFEVPDNTQVALGCPLIVDGDLILGGALVELD